MGGYTFACESSGNYSTASTYETWHAFDGNTSTNWLAQKGGSTALPYWITFYNPEPLNVVDISIRNAKSEGYRVTLNGYVEGSEDNIKWTRLATYTNGNTTHGAVWHINMPKNFKAFKYHRVYSTEIDVVGTNYAWAVPEMGITAYTYDDDMPVIVSGVTWANDYEHSWFIKY